MRRQQRHLGADHTQQQVRAVVAPTVAVKMVDGLMAPQPMALRQGHGNGRSDRQTGATAAAAGANQASAGVRAHPHPKAGDAFALAAGAFQCAFRHESL